jgi:hypothetical protein
MQKVLRPVGRVVRWLFRDREPPVRDRGPKKPVFFRPHIERLEERLSPSSLFPGNSCAFPHNPG